MPSWEEVRDALPLAKTLEDKKKRMELWKKFNPTGPKTLTVAELDGGIRDVLECEELFRAKDVIQRAHKYAREVNPGGPGDCLEFVEFRLLLSYLKGLMGVYLLFTELDDSGDMQLDLDEFTTACPKFEPLGIVIADPEALFEKLTGTDGSVSFGEFADWATRQGMAGDALMEVELANDKAADEELAHQLKEALKSWECCENGLVRSQDAKDLFRKLLPDLPKQALDALVDSTTAPEFGMIDPDALIDSIVLSQYE